jgi:molybdopterin-guanine dinucleotide biosynthesis protein A
VQGLLARIRTTVLKPSPAEARQLANVNTPEEHRQLGDAGHGTARLDRER